TTKHLAIVLNQTELQHSTGQLGEAGARLLMDRSGAEVVIVKQGPDGALVVDASGTAVVPPYRADSIFKIGSGDIFSGVFACLWAERGLDALQAADAASRAVARYVESRNAQIDLDTLGRASPVSSKIASGRIYVAGPFFTLAQRWLIDEIRRC